MRVPVSGHMNLVTGEMTFEYIECEEKKFAEFMVGIALQVMSNKQNLPTSTAEQ